jgi:hypothetical protein
LFFNVFKKKYTFNSFPAFALLSLSHSHKVSPQTLTKYSSKYLLDCCIINCQSSIFKKNQKKKIIPLFIHKLIYSLNSTPSQLGLALEHIIILSDQITIHPLKRVNLIWFNLIYYNNLVLLFIFFNGIFFCFFK